MSCIFGGGKWVDSIWWCSWLYALAVLGEGIHGSGGLNWVWWDANPCTFSTAPWACILPNTLMTYHSSFLVNFEVRSVNFALFCFDLIFALEPHPALAFWATPSTGLLLALFSGTVPGWSQGTMWDAGDWASLHLAACKASALPIVLSLQLFICFSF